MLKLMFSYDNSVLFTDAGFQLANSSIAKDCYHSCINASLYLNSNFRTLASWQWNLIFFKKKTLVCTFIVGKANGRNHLERHVSVIRQGNITFTHYSTASYIGHLIMPAAHQKLVPSIAVLWLCYVVSHDICSTLSSASAWTTPYSITRTVSLATSRTAQTTISLNSYCIHGNPGVMSLVTWQNQAMIPSFDPGHMYGRWGEDPIGKPRKRRLEDVENYRKKMGVRVLTCVIPVVFCTTVSS